MFGGTAKEIVVIEIEVDDLAVSIDRETSDIVAKVAIPIDAKLIRVFNHVAAEAMGRITRLPLGESSWIVSERSALIPVPEAVNQLHEKETVNLVAFPYGLDCQFRCRLFEVDGG